MADEPQVKTPRRRRAAPENAPAAKPTSETSTATKKQRRARTIRPFPAGPFEDAFGVLKGNLQSGKWNSGSQAYSL